MKKENLALALIIVCCVGAFIGLINVFRTPDGIGASTTKDKSDASLSKIFQQDKIALISLNGPITDNSSGDSEFFMSTSPAMKAKKYLNKATKDKSVKAVILRINSPGGTVAASQEVYNAVIRCREEKPVIVSMGDLAASGGYYIASAADVIVANPGTLTGSIGVILNAVDFSELFDKFGIKSNVIKSGKFKDIGSGFRPMTAQDKELLQALIDNAYQQFTSAIEEGRIERSEKPKKSKKSTKKTSKGGKNYSEETVLTLEVLKKYADGRIFTGKQAKELGFVDELGDLYKAKEVAIKMAQARFKGVKDSIDVEEYDKPRTVSEFLLEMSTNLKPEVGIKEEIPFSVSHPNQPLWIMEY